LVKEDQIVMVFCGPENNRQAVDGGGGATANLKYSGCSYIAYEPRTSTQNSRRKILDIGPLKTEGLLTTLGKLAYAESLLGDLLTGAWIPVSNGHVNTGSTLCRHATDIKGASLQTGRTQRELEK
jgi:hypothetical protein